MPLIKEDSTLDLRQELKEKHEILNNPKFGKDKKEREENLKKTQKIAAITKFTGIGIGIWTFIFNNHYKYALIASIIFPILCVFLLNYYKGLIKIEGRKNTPYPSILFGVFSTITAVIARSFLDFKILDYTNVWIPIFVIAFLAIAFLLFRNEEFKFIKTNNFMSIFALLILSFSYAYGSYISLNCIYDTSKPEIFNTSILEKRMTYGKQHAYYFKLTPWGKQIAPHEITVSQMQYESHYENEELKVYLMKGKFKIPWFEITDKNTSLK